MKNTIKDQLKGRVRDLRKHYHGHNVKRGNVRHSPLRPLHCLFLEQFLEGIEGPSLKLFHFGLFIQGRVDEKRLDHRWRLHPSSLAGEVPPPSLTLAFRGGRDFCVLGGALTTFIEPEPLCFFCGRTLGLGTTPPFFHVEGARGNFFDKARSKAISSQGSLPLESFASTHMINFL